MTALPIVVETYPWLSLSFGGFMILVGAAFARGAIAELQSDGDPSGPRTAVAAVTGLGFLAFGACIALQDVHWQFRLDEKGVVLRAPFDIMRPGGEIAWADLTSAYVRGYTSHGSVTHQLHFVGKDGTHITLATADDLPARFDPLLQALVEERAPQAKGAHDIAGQLADAHANSGAGISNGYWVRNGRGERVR